MKWRGREDAPVSDAVVAAIADVDAKMSTWRPDSELSRAREAGVLAVSEDTAFVVRAALSFAEATGGRFDPTVQPLMELWGFHGTPRTERPTDDEIAAAMAHVGWKKVQVTYSEEGPRLVTGGTALDLSAIAKGYAVDRAGHAVSSLGIEDWLVEIGGEVRAAGSKGRGEPWLLGIDAPAEGTAPGKQLASVVALSNMAMATSGNYRNLVEIEGERYAHTFDPRVGQPIRTAVASATVIAPDCMTADGLATALMVLPPEKGLALVESRSDVEALLLVSGGAQWEHQQSSGMKHWLP